MRGIVFFVRATAGDPAIHTNPKTSGPGRTHYVARKKRNNDRDQGQIPPGANHEKHMEDSGNQHERQLDYGKQPVGVRGMSEKRHRMLSD